MHLQTMKISGNIKTISTRHNNRNTITNKRAMFRFFGNFLCMWIIAKHCCDQTLQIIKSGFPACSRENPLMSVHVNVFVLSTSSTGLIYMHAIFGAPHMYLTILRTVNNASHCLQRIQRLLFRWIFYRACDGSIGGRRRFKQIIQCADYTVRDAGP